ncbi:MAG: DUF6861 domain-containing protein, partial [Polyangiales bacterium]
ELTAILEGLIPGLLLCLALVVATTALGGAAGAAIGALAAGIGAAPGAVLGATAGLEAGLALLEGLGLAFLAFAIGKSLGEAIRLSTAAVKEAWRAIEDPPKRFFHVEHAGRTFAQALAALVRGILQGVVAFLLAKGGEAAASRVPELVAKLRQSRLGTAFATWVEQSWGRLIKNERLRPPEPKTGGGGGAGAGQTAAPPAAARPPAPKEPPPPAKPREEPAPPKQPEKKPEPTKAASRAETLQKMQDVAANGDVSTPPDGLYLWSGGGMKGAGGAAERSALANGGKTLEQTPTGKELTRLQEELGPWETLSAAEKEQTMGAWTTASERLAQNASGEVNVVVEPTKLRKDAIIFDELNRLDSNIDVTNVKVVDTSGNVLSDGSAQQAASVLRGIVQ